jgi:hypothetical protein
MESELLEDNEVGAPSARERRVSKKNQIISLFTSGLGSVEEIALITATRPGYVASVLQNEGLITGYFDLYTPSAQRMNIHSRFFTGKLGFRDEETARRSVNLINRYYHQFEVAGDRAGQHHALMMALVMFNRARWTRKEREADIFRQWLLRRLSDAEFYFRPGETFPENTFESEPEALPESAFGAEPERPEWPQHDETAGEMPPPNANQATEGPGLTTS